MRIRFYAVVLLALAALCVQPHTAAAQIEVKRTQWSPADLDSVKSAALQRVNDDMHRLFAAQRAYYAEHGRFATNYAQLPELLETPDSGIVLNGGDDWYVALGGGPEIGVVQHVVTVTPRRQQAATHGEGAAAPR